LFDTGESLRTQSGISGVLDCRWRLEVFFFFMMHDNLS
jgi:hypothetical protein